MVKRASQDVGLMVRARTVGMGEPVLGDGKLGDGKVVKPVVLVRMKGRNATPRWKQVCTDCLHWLAGDVLVDHVLDLVREEAPAEFTC